MLFFSLLKKAPFSMESSGTRSGAMQRNNTNSQEPDSFLTSPRAWRIPSRREAAAPGSCQGQPRLGRSQWLPESAKYPLFPGSAGNVSSRRRSWRLNEKR